MPKPSNEAVGPRASRAVLLLMVASAAVLLLVVGIASRLHWDRGHLIAMLAPAAIWAGVMAAVLYRLTSSRRAKPAGTQL